MDGNHGREVGVTELGVGCQSSCAGAEPVFLTMQRGAPGTVPRPTRGRAGADMLIVFAGGIRSGT